MVEEVAARFLSLSMSTLYIHNENTVLMLQCSVIYIAYYFVSRHERWTQLLLTLPQSLHYSGHDDGATHGNTWMLPLEEAAAIAVLFRQNTPVLIEPADDEPNK